MQRVFLKRFEQDDQGLKRELRARQKLPPHPAILQPTGFFIHQGSRFLEFPFCEHGNLLEHTTKLRGDGLDAAELCDSVRHFAQQALLGLSHLHQNRVVHKDVKPQNLLLSSDGRVLLTDFELSRVESAPGVTQQATTTLGLGAFTPGYAAPEVERLQPATSASDVFSMGVTLHHLHHGCMPQTQAQQKIPAASGGPLDNLLRQMLDSDPKNRPTAHECLLSPYFRESEAVRARTSGEMSRLAERLCAARAQMHLARTPVQRRHHEIRINRATLLTDGLRAIKGMFDSGRLKRPLRVEFQNEDGIDEGGLTSELYTKLWKGGMQALACSSVRGNARSCMHVHVYLHTSLRVCSS